MKRFVIFVIIAFIIYVVIRVSIVLKPKDEIDEILKDCERVLTKIKEDVDDCLIGPNNDPINVLNEKSALLEKVYNSPIKIYKPTAKQYKKCKELLDLVKILRKDVY